MHYGSALPTWDLHNERVIVRAGMNAPRDGATIIDDFRINATRPTLDYILKAGGRIVLLTHLGRPKDKEPELSTQILLPLLKSYGYEVTFAPTIFEAKLSTAPITLLENVRFFPEEQEHETGMIGRIKEKWQRNNFAKELASLGSHYVNDAFDTMHRTDTSVTLLAQQFPAHRRTYGFLVGKEMKALNTLLGLTTQDGTTSIEPKQPFCVLAGGAKAETKIPLLGDMASLVDTFLLAPTLSRTITNYNQGDTTMTSAIKQLLTKTCVTPLDYVVAQDTLDGSITTVDHDKVPNNALELSIGPKTVELFSDHLRAAKNILFSGLFGLEHREETLEPAKELIKIIAEANAFTVVAGGSTVAAVRKFGYESHINHLSTGGGSTLAYLASGGPNLPGLSALMN